MFSGKMWTSSATSEPSRWPTVVVPMNLPLAMSSTLAFVIPITTKLSASFTFMLSPLRAFTVRIWPSSDWTVPRILTGGFAGAWAQAAAARAVRQKQAEQLLDVPGNRVEGTQPLQVRGEVGDPLRMAVRADHREKRSALRARHALRDQRYDAVDSRCVHVGLALYVGASVVHVAAFS